MTTIESLSKREQKLNEDIKLFPQVHPIEPDMKISRKGVSRLVMLDRYSFKDLELITLGVGDLVLLTYEEDPKFPKRGYGEVIAIEDDMVTVKLDDQFENGMVLTVPKNKIDKPLEIYYEQIVKRVARGLAAVEQENVREYWQQRFEEKLLEDIIPAGRVLMGAGTNKGVTFFNCYVMPFIHDSRGGISDHRKIVMEIMSRGGGVGTNGSTLRPRQSIAKGVNGRSSGSVTWLHDLSNLTNLVEQGGSRRGAQMIMLADWHPDIVEFIISKVQNPNVLHYILRETNDELIHREVKRKLKFKKLTESEKLQYEIVVNTLTFKKQQAELFPLEWPGLTKAEEKLLQEAKQKLKDGGTYEVHDPNFLTGANISVCITNDFMKAIENDDYYELRFPDIDNYDDKMREIYNNEWHKIGDVREWEALGYPIKTHYRIKAKELWKLINICATYSAEPGIFFIDNANDMTNAKAYGEKVVATNPCGEQPLAPFSVCNLSAINLSVMVKDKQVDYNRLKEAVKISVRLQDNVIDATPYFLKENKEMALGERRVGMGVMGLHDLLLQCGVGYGTEEGNQIIDKVFETIATTAYETSIELAKEKGSFPFLDTLPDGTPNINGREKFINSGYMKKMPEHIRQGILKHGIRNSHLLTVAPTGSTGTMMNVSTGLEPYFNYIYYRSGRLGQFIPVVADIALKWLKENGYDVENEDPAELIKHLPNYFTGAMDLTPEQHVNVQCIIQRWVDSSISKTVNAPRGYKVSQVQTVYESLHKGGAKGGTVYVDGSRDSQVLTLTIEENDFNDVPIEGDNTKVVLQTETQSEKKIGYDEGDICAMCETGTMINSGGCITCSHCGIQTKCGL